MKDKELKAHGFTRESGRLRLLDRQAIAEAPEKVLDALRLAAELGLDFDPDTKQALAEAAGKLPEVGPGKLGPAWRAFASTKEKRRALELLDEVGGVESLLPEIYAMKGVEQPPQWHPEGDVWVHTLLSLEYLGEADAFVTTVTLLHDVGKPPTFEVSDRIRFTKHDSLGGRMARGIARRLGFSAEEAEDIEWAVKAHMKFKHVKEMRPGRLKNLVLDPRFEALAAMVRADCLASHGDTSDVDFAVSSREEALKEQNRPEALVQGRDLVEMGLAPGPRIGEILRKVEALREKGEITSRAQAKKFLKKFLKIPDAHN